MSADKAIAALWDAYFGVWRTCSGAWDWLDDLEKVLSELTGESEKAISEKGAASRGKKWGPVMLNDRKRTQARVTQLEKALRHVLRADCPADTNGDGDCGRRGCPYCGEEIRALLTA